MKRIFNLLALILLAGSVHAQASLDAYVAEALESNLLLREKKLALNKSFLALQDARSFFLPTSTLEGQYSLAHGGRSIDLPVGDLMNPVYKTLNQLTSSHNFPSIENVSEQLLPNDFYDLKMHSTMPLLNPGLRINQQIRSEQVDLEKSSIDAYRRELVKDVKLAYYHLLQAAGAIGIYQNAIKLVQQNLQVQQSLLRNGKGLPAYVSRAESELASVEAQLRRAQADESNARAYLNFLRNKPLNEAITRMEPPLPPEALMADAANAAPDVSHREELKSLGIAERITARQLQLARSFRRPLLNAFLDIGTQGFQFKVNNKAPYILGGINVQVPLFAGRRNITAIQQAEIEGKTIGIRREAAQKQLELLAYTSRNGLRTAAGNLEAARKREEAARQYFKLVDRGYIEGVNSFIEFLDARNQLTNAKLELSIETYALQIAAAELELQTASYPLP